ncbi:MAG: hypothetical protein HKO04_04670 [Silicimonas sp.]|nr:hypothetical protein [Silicimonas sp.]
MAAWVDKAIQSMMRHRKSSALAACAICAFTVADPATAQSPHACVGLQDMRVPMTEGLDGFFFRVEPDLMMDTRLSDGMIRDVAKLSRSLETRGTTLVYVPIPTKGIVHSDSIGPDAARYGFDARLARALFGDTIAKLRASEVVTVDALAPLIRNDADETVFYGADPRMSDTGLRLLAGSIAAELGPEHQGTTEFGTTAGRPSAIPSHDRFLLQMACQASLPPLTAPRYTTRALQHSGPGADRNVVVVGSHITSGPERNLSGFLSEALRRPVTRDVSAETAHGALTSYLTSETYRADQPEIIIWQVPIWENPARFGDQPMRELSAAAADRCSGATEMARFEDGSFRVDARGLSVTHDASLRLETESGDLMRAIFRFTAPDGAERARSITRHDTTLATNRMYLPLTGLWPEGVAEISVEIDPADQAAPTISVCGAS